MRRITGVLAGLLLVALAASPVMAADYGVAIGDSVTLSKSKMAVTVPVRLMCTLADPSYDLLVQSVTVDVSQAVGKRIAHGEGWAGGRDFIVCDGTWKSVTVSVTADPSGPPFGGGWLSVAAHAEYMEGVQSGCDGCGFIYVDQYVSAAPVDRKAR